MKLSTDCSAISKTKIKEWAKNLFELDAQIKVLNFVKSDIYKRAAAEYNKSVRDGLKEAVRLISMEPDKRLQAEAAKGYAQTILGMLEEEQPDAQAANPVAAERPIGFEAWQAQRNLERSKPFTHALEETPHDPETGEIGDQIEALTHVRDEVDPSDVTAAGELPVPSPTRQDRRALHLDELVIPDGLDIPPFLKRQGTPSNSQH